MRTSKAGPDDIPALKELWKQAFGDTDAVIAATTLELLLRKCDIGSCWGGYLTRLAEQLPGVKAELGVPEGYHIACTLLCGYPDEPYRNIPWRPHADVIWK